MVLQLETVPVKAFDWDDDRAYQTAAASPQIDLTNQAIANNLTLNAITTQVEQLKQTVLPTNMDADSIVNPPAAFKQLFKQIEKDRHLWKVQVGYKNSRSTSIRFGRSSVKATPNPE